MSALAKTLSLLPKVKAMLAARKSQLLQQLEGELDLCPEIRANIETAIVDDPPLQLSDGGVFQTGFHERLDQLRELAKGGKAWMARYQAEQSERTGIPNLKVGFNKIIGYYLEVTLAHQHKVPEDYKHEQKLKNQQRFSTPELKEYEEKVLTAEEESIELEQELFLKLREEIAQHIPRIQQTADVVAQTDVLASLAVLASKRNYNRPEVTEEPILEIKDGRHPVLDALQPTGAFVPNDIMLNDSVPPDSTSQKAAEGISTEELHKKDPDEAVENSGLQSETSIGQSNSRVQIITGPNMAGKSTYIRQAALLTLMAQMGSYIPVSSATIGIADRIFARVGASDDLSKGQSTFMVEMTETARILNSATNRSLVILDEIGRGTSTYDGISLAWAVTEFLHDEIQCRTMFATHYHELTTLTKTLHQASNWNVAVSETSQGIKFLHKMVPGAANKSYGIYVAKLAGIPWSVIKRANLILNTLESDHLDESGRTKIPRREAPQHKQLLLFGSEDHPLFDEIRSLDLDQMSPLDALQELHRLRDELSE